MNSKLVKASLAGAAAIALAAGGGTFAAYSDFADITGNNAGAGTLVLDLGGSTTGADAIKFSHVLMAPGDVQAERNVYMASNVGTAPTKSKLYFTLKDLVGVEDGCDGNGEIHDDANCSDVSAANQGQFIKDALLTVTSYTTDSPGHCNPSYATTATDVTPEVTHSLQDWATQTATTPYELTGDRSAFGGPNVSTLSNGQGLCLSMQIGLPHSANNESQGDSASFTTHIDLDQV